MMCILPIFFIGLGIAFFGWRSRMPKQDVVERSGTLATGAYEIHRGGKFKRNLAAAAGYLSLALAPATLIGGCSFQYWQDRRRHERAEFIRRLYEAPLGTNRVMPVWMPRMNKDRQHEEVFALTLHPDRWTDVAPIPTNTGIYLEILQTEGQSENLGLVYYHNQTLGLGSMMFRVLPVSTLGRTNRFLVKSASQRDVRLEIILNEEMGKILPP
jgi:hypothetical protein